MPHKSQPVVQKIKPTLLCPHTNYWDMASCLIFSALLMSFISSSTAKDSVSKLRVLDAAIQEMQKADYFSFVMLLNMSPTDQIPGNITFLMPNDRALAKATIPDNSILGFLLRHSIPSPLLFDYLKHFPTGSKIPSSEPGYVLEVSNNGRRSYFLNNVKIVSPNICVAGHAIRCHGIDGVLFAANNTLPSFTCPGAAPVAMATPPTLSPQPSPPPLAIDFNLTPADAPQPAGSNSNSHHSGPSKVSCGQRRVESLAAYAMIFYFVVIQSYEFRIFY